MIRNERQYEITQQQLAKFETAMRDLPQNPPDNVHPLLWKAQRDGLESQVRSFKDELTEWEARKELTEQGGNHLST